MTPEAPYSSAETLAQALYLCDCELLDVRAGRRDEDRAKTLRLALRGAGLRDEHRAEVVVKRLLDARPDWLDLVETLCARLFALEQGLPTVRREPLARRLLRLVDPDALLCLHPGLALPGGEPFDWPALPLAGDDGARLLRDGSVDTHIHLGGSLPPLFYWMALVGGDLPLEALPSLGSSLRGHAAGAAWQRAIARALHHRLALACWLQRGRAGGGRCFPHLPGADDPLWAPFAALTPDAEHQAEGPVGAGDWGGIETPLTIAAAAWQLGAALRRDRPREERRGSLADPLRGTTDAAHYAAGERRLLCRLALRLRAARGCGQYNPAVETCLLGYLRTRNAFHQWFCHDSGPEGLLRFGEGFGRRGFQYSVLRPRRPPPGPRGRRQRRYRRQIAQLERLRTAAALDAQLVDAFGGLGPRSVGACRVALVSGSVRRIELRVSIPRGSLAIATVRAWLEGVRRHLGHNADPFPSQVGLVFHLIKQGDPQAPSLIARRAREAAERLGALLLGYPQLRPFIVGLDAAGGERGYPPRLYGEAFAHLRDLQARCRPARDEPPIALGWTFHVGEDGDDLLSGLRHCDEVAAHLLDGGVGRLGHGLALALDARRFYLTRGGEVEPTLGAHLLDLVWAWGRLVHSPRAGEAPDLHWLEARIQALLKAAAGQQRRGLGHSTPGATAGPGRSGDREIADCWQAMQLEPLARPADAFSGDDAADRRMLSERELLGHLGLAGAAEGAGDARITLVADDRWMALITRLQGLLRERLARCRITLEVNPTSNLLIGGFHDYAELPYRAMTDSGLAVSLNTDDPGLFMTSLPNEYAALHRALIGPLPHHEASLWLEGRRLDAANSTFLGVGTPTGRDAARCIDSGRPFVHWPGGR